MKKKILCFILFFIICLITITGCVANANNNEKKNKEKKEDAEIEYVENKLMVLMNYLNNITFENYNVTVTQINQSSQINSDSDNSNENTDQDEETGGEGTKGNDSSENEDISSNGESEKKVASGSETKSKSSNKQYKLKKVGILTRDDNIDWDNIKNEVELMYTVLPTVTMDLYKKNVNQDYILNFNKEMDILTKSVEKEDKKETIKTLATLYSYIPKYSRSISSETKSLVIETKSNVFYAYSLAETDDWDKMKEYTQKALEVYSRIFNNVDEENNQNTINKSYILLNELNNSIDTKNKDIFFIKYKNLLEELNMIV